jgi:hypothetical protein
MKTNNGGWLELAALTWRTYIEKYFYTRLRKEMTRRNHTNNTILKLH